MRLSRARVAAALLTLTTLVIAPLCVWGWLRTSLPDYNGTVGVAGLGDEALIIRDRRAVPHIKASSVSDALFALGYAHAQDRLFMLEFYRHQSQGRLAELIGPQGLESDIEVRLMNSEITPATVTSGQDPSAIARMSAYVSGINAFLARRTGALPPEFLYLGASPARWTVADGFMIDNLTDFARSGWSREIEYLILRQRLPEAVVDAVQSDYADIDFASLGVASWSVERVAPVALERPVTPASFSRGSNAWAVSAARSTTADVLFAADPHLPFTLPSTFTPVQISTPEWKFAGFVIPGIAWFAGNNSYLHWAMTHADEDMTDVYIEESDPTGSQYRTAEGWSPYTVQNQLIRVRGAPDVPIRIRLTKRGPVISDHLKRAREARATLAENRVLVLAGVDATKEPSGGRLYGLNHELMLTRTIAEAEQVLTRQLDVDNVILADHHGNIAIRTVAAVLQREAVEGYRPREGWRTAGDGGTKFVASDDLPRVVNPPSGCVFNANQPVEPRESHCGHAPVNSLRAERLRSRLVAKKQHDLASFRSVQLDTTSIAAVRMLPTLRSLPVTNRLEREARAALEGWDGDARVDSIAASIFYVWLREFDRAITGELSKRWGVDLPRPSLQRYAEMLQGGSDWCRAVALDAGDALTACHALALSAFQKAVKLLDDAAGSDPAAWQWGRFHEAVFEHPVFSSVPLLRRFAERRVPVPGGPDTVNAADGGWGTGVAFPVYHGALTRRLERVGDGPQNRVAFAAGVSGNPLSRHYDDQIVPWSRGEYFSIEDDGHAVHDEAMSTLRLVPE